LRHSVYNNNNTWCLIIWPRNSYFNVLVADPEAATQTDPPLTSEILHPPLFSCHDTAMFN